jgi:hypothetical protein
MAMGPGRYDDLCTHVRVLAQAEAALVIIIGGVRGHGFSVQTTDPRLVQQLPDLLEAIAVEIRETLARQDDT